MRGRGAIFPDLDGVIVDNGPSLHDAFRRGVSEARSTAACGWNGPRAGDLEGVDLVLGSLAELPKALG